MNLHLPKIIATCITISSIAFSADISQNEKNRAHYTDMIQYKTEALQLIEQAHINHMTVAPRFAMGEFQGPGLFVPKIRVYQPYGGITRFKVGSFYEIPEDFCNERLAAFKVFSLSRTQEAEASQNFPTFIANYKQELANDINNYQTLLDELDVA